MLNKLKTKFKTQMIEKEYSKTDRLALRDLEQLLKDDIINIINESESINKLINKQYEKLGSKEQFSAFLIKKIDENIVEVNIQIDKLTRLQKDTKYKFRDMYEAYSRISKLRKLNLISREYLFALKDEIREKLIKSEEDTVE